MARNTTTETVESTETEPKTRVKPDLGSVLGKFQVKAAPTVDAARIARGQLRAQIEERAAALRDEFVSEFYGVIPDEELASALTSLRSVGGRLKAGVKVADDETVIAKANGTFVAPELPTQADVDEDGAESVEDESAE